MCSCLPPADHAATSRYVDPVEDDFVLRYDPHGEFTSFGVGLVCEVDAYGGGLPRAHVLFENGTVLVDCLFLFQTPGFAVLDPCWFDYGLWS